MAIGETAASKQGHKHPDFDVHWIEERFVCIAECNRSSCAETVTIAGSTSHDIEIDGDGAHTVQTLKADFVKPAPPIIEIPRRCPPELRSVIESSFGLFWSDSGACANRLRSSVEVLLTHLGVKRSKRTKSGRLRRLGLEERIKLLPKKHNALVCEIHAVKWIGHAGSHSEPITRDDALDGYEMLQVVLEELFAQRRKMSARLAREINKRKRPRSTRRGSPSP